MWSHDVHEPVSVDVQSVRSLAGCHPCPEVCPLMYENSVAEKQKQEQIEMCFMMAACDFVHLTDLNVPHTSQLMESD